MSISLKKIGITSLVVVLLISTVFFFIHSWGKEQEAKPKVEETVSKVSASARVVKSSVQQIKPEANTPPKLSATQQTKPVANTNHLPATSKRRFLICIDPGHQRKADLGKEPVGPGATETKIKVTGGTTGVTSGKPEYVLALQASNMLKDLLEAKGFQVIMTRTSNDVDLSNRERAEIANQHRADLFIRIHADGSENPNTKGLSVLTPSSNDPYTHAIYADSLKVSQLILKKVKKDRAITVLGLRYREDLSGFNWSKVPSTLIEMGYMTNPKEDKNLSDPVYLKRLLGDIADGIAAYADGT